MILVGIAGPAGHGKNEIAKIVKTKYSVAKMYFAYPLKKMICVLTGEPMSKWEDREWKESPHPCLGGKSPRFAAQTLGSEWGRDIMDKSLWIDFLDRSLKSEIDLIDGLADFGIITDLRFNNEADWIRNQGGTIVHVKSNRSSTMDNPDHKSESGIAPQYDDYEIYNIGSLDQLVTNTFEVFDNVLVGR